MSLTEPRQVRVTSCTLFSPGMTDKAPNGVSILPFLQQVDIFESIFDNTISASVMILENVGLIELVPIVGAEFFWIAFEVDDEFGKPQKFERQFRVTKIRDVSYPRQDFRLFTLDLSTHEFVTSVAHRISRQYAKKTVQEAVKDIITRDLDAGGRIKTLEDTFGKVTITIPNYTPLQAINFFVLLAQTKKKKESNFVFFETLAGFHFTSISKLIEDGKIAAKDTVFMINPGATGKPLVEDGIMRNAIHRIYQDQTADLLVDIAGGMLRCQMIHFDFLARKLEHTEDSRYTETFKKTTHLHEGNPVYPENYDQSLSKNVRTFTFPTNVWTNAGSWVKGIEPDAPDQKLYESIVLHNRQLKEITHVQTLIEMPGHPEIRAGSVMNIQYPSTRYMSPDSLVTQSIPEVNTPLFTGPHLVTAVRHLFIPEGNGQFEYKMHLKVCKDSHRTKLTTFKKGETYE